MHLLERQEQLARMNRCLQEACAGCGKLLLIAGGAGLGKSSLVEGFVAEHRRDTRALWGACDALSTPRALAPVHEIAAQTSGGRGARSGDSRDWLFRVLLEEFARTEGGCVVVLEDLHWADAATLDFLRFIGRRIQRTRALFIGTYRDDELSSNDAVRLALGELTGDHVIRMRLEPLSLAAVDVLAKDTARDVGLLHRITGGNPFFVREVLASPGELVPQTVRDAVLARLARCSPPARELAELVSISPGMTESWLIESVLGQRQTELDEAGARGLLGVHSDSVGFRHEIARLAVLGTLPSERARVLHGLVLRALAARGADPARLVHHAVLAHDTARIIEYAPHAAREAARLGAHREAATHLDAALRHGATLSALQRARLLDQHAEESSLANQTQAAIASWTEAAAAWGELGDATAQSRALGLLTQEYRTVGDRARADQCVARAISLLEAQPPSAALAGAYCARALLALHRGWNFEALEFGRRALALAREAGDQATESHALCHIGGALLGLDDRSGYEPLERSLAIALQLRLEDQAARAYRTLEFYASLTRDSERATRAFHEGVDYCEERGIFSHSAYIRSYHTICALWRGEWADAARMAEELLRTAEVTGPTQRVTVMTTLAVVRMRRGDPGPEPLLDEALALALPTAEVNRIARVAAARAEHAWYQGRLPDVLTESSIGLAQVREHPSPWLNGELLYWQSRVQATAVSGEVAEPYRLMLGGDWHAAAGAWARIGAPYEQALALAEGTEESLRQALAIVERLGAGPLAALIRRRMRAQGVRGIPRGPNEATRANPSGLTARELEVLRLLAQGCNSTQLARRLHRSPKTIDHHVGALLEKLGVHSRAEAVAAAFARGILAAGGDPARDDSLDVVR
ncbi:MAG TPA: AAA family ATPase [Steroidobacteraceae bacterium]|nr:AAA family ATPase [Steroidobacteraceae bacterium]